MHKVSRKVVDYVASNRLDVIHESLHTSKGLSIEGQEMERS